MKKIIFYFLLIFLIGCEDASLDSPMETVGEIISIKKVQKHDVNILVQIKIRNYSSYYSLWFKGSDTCRVGQIVKLQ